VVYGVRLALLLSVMTIAVGRSILRIEWSGQAGFAK
jgi:hypothetical protein